MHLDNVRIGHACNSSSTHSFLIPSGTVETDEWSEFGWQSFTVAPEDIDHYLAATLWANLSYDGSSEKGYRERIAREIKERLGVEVDYGAYVDHQSCLTFPYAYDGESFNWEYVEAVRSYLKRQGVGVSGGNDNDDSDRTAFDGKCVEIPGPHTEGHGYTWVARYSGNQWSLFNRKSGDRMRVRFDDKEPCRPDAPELVDIKITDYCSSNCGYCYQGSTKDGEHAKVVNVFRVIRELASMQVFEIAIGGGEATDHPQFKSFCEVAKSLGITPNLTTRNYNFVRDNYQWCTEMLGTIAVSVDNTNSVRRVAALNELQDGSLKFNVQVVCGGCWGIESIIAEAAKFNLGLTLLGFKEQERGSGYRKTDYSGWRKAVSEHYKRGFNVDTAFLKLHKAELQQMVGDQFKRYAVMYEGMHSCYIDAVAMQIAPSSFCDKSKYLPIVGNDVQDAWKKIEAE